SSLGFRVPPPEPLLRYTTLFRSVQTPRRTAALTGRRAGAAGARDVTTRRAVAFDVRGARADAASRFVIERRLRLRELGGLFGIRSEEHTSELQSRENLVCRLLLE